MGDENRFNLFAEAPDLVVRSAGAQTSAFVAQWFPMRFAVTVHAQTGENTK